MVVIEAVMSILVGIVEYNVHKGCAVIDWVISPYYGLLIHLCVINKLYSSQEVKDL